jgi:hypothetical protein
MAQDYEDEAPEADVSPDEQLPEGLAAAVASEITDAISYMDESVADIQAQMTEYYKGELPGVTQEDVDDNRSDIVSRDVHDAVQAVMPDLIRTFLGAENVVEFKPAGPDDDAYASQATDAIRHIFENDNDAFGIIHGALKDGLIRKYAVATWRHEEKDLSYEKEYSGLDDAALTVLTNEPNIEVLELEPSTSEEPEEGVDPMMPVTYEVKVLHKRSEHRYCVELVPPEELIVSRKARTARGDRFIGRRRNLTVDELVDMGYDREEVMQYAGSGGDTQLSTNELAYERNPDGQNFGPDRGDDGAKEVLYVEGYMPWSVGDSLRLVKVCALGSAHEVKKWEMVDCIPMTLWTPDPEPHTPIGESPAEKVADIQRMKTEVWRGVLDSLAEALVPRTEVVEGQVNIDDALSNEIGALVRVRAPGMVRPLSSPFVGQQALPLLQLADQMREERVGAFRAADGLSAETMQSSTKMAVAATITGSKAQKELLARVFAAQFLKPIFKGLLKLFVENQDQPRWIRMRGNWVNVDPRGWNAEMDCVVDVALAVSTTEERLQVLGAIAEKQEQILQQMGPDNPLVGFDQYSYTLRKMVEVAGFKNVDAFFKPADPNWQPQQQAQPQPDPALILAEQQVKALQAEIVRKDREAEAKATIDAERLVRDDDFRRDKLDQDRTLALTELEMKYGMQAVQADMQIRADIEKNREQMAQQAQIAAAQPAGPAPDGAIPQ